MKTKLTVSIDKDLIPEAKQYALDRGVSLSSLIERALRDLSSAPANDFTDRWRGQFRPAGRGDLRYRRLAGKYL